MTFEEFMDLKVGDLIYYENQWGMVRKVVDMKKGTVMYGGYCKHNIREVHLLLHTKRGKDMMFPRIYVDYPDAIRNKMTLAKIEIDDLKEFKEAFPSFF